MNTQHGFFLGRDQSLWSRMFAAADYRNFSGEAESDVLSSASRDALTKLLTGSY